MDGEKEPKFENEIDFLRAEKQVKDDTIGFLQREKEMLMKEIKHYESLCSQVEFDVTTRMQQEESIKHLKAEIAQYKLQLAEQRHRMRGLRESKPLSAIQHTLVTDVSKRTAHLLANCCTSKSEELKDLVESLDMKGDSSTLPWTILELINRALGEVIQFCYRLENNQPKFKMRYVNKNTTAYFPPAKPNSVHSRQNITEAIQESPELQTPRLATQDEAQPEKPIFMRMTHGKLADRPWDWDNGGWNSPSTALVDGGIPKLNDLHGASSSAKLMQMAKKRLESINRNRELMKRTSSAPDSKIKDRRSLPGLKWMDQLS